MRLSKELDYTADVSLLDHLEEGIELLLVVPLGHPLQVELALVEALHYLELVVAHPVLPRVLLEVHCEVRVHHRACQVLRGQRREPLPHELVDYVLVGLGLCLDAVDGYILSVGLFLYCVCFG